MYDDIIALEILGRDAPYISADHAGPIAAVVEQPAVLVKTSVEAADLVSPSHELCAENGSDVAIGARHEHSSLAPSAATLRVYAGLARSYQIFHGAFPLCQRLSSTF